MTTQDRLRALLVRIQTWQRLPSDDDDCEYPTELICGIGDEIAALLAEDEAREEPLDSNGRPDDDYAHWRHMAADNVNHFWFTNREAGVLLAHIDRLRGELATSSAATAPHDLECPTCGARASDFEHGFSLVPEDATEEPHD
jgi:hypothetical protein